MWLLDYRASPDLPSSGTQFTVDDIAMRDWPAAIAHVRRETGADSVQALGHCIGGLSLFMAIGGGLEGVRSATFSALAGHPIPTPANRLRAGVRVPTVFRKLGIKGLSTDYGPDSLPDRALERVMRALPISHVHDSPVGRRIYFIYGDVFDHERIDEETMDEAVPSFFGNSNMTFFEHMALMIRKGAAPSTRRAATSTSPTPTATGCRSRSSPASTTGCSCRAGSSPRTTCCARPTGPSSTRHHVIEDYAHLDMWLGDDAERDVFPIALAELERHNS